MKRNWTILGIALLLLLAFGSANAMTLRADISGTAVYERESTKKIQPNEEFTVEIYSNNNDDYRSIWTSPFVFTGTNTVTTANFGSIAKTDVASATFRGYWTLLDTTYVESWDGTLPDLFCYTGAGFPGYPAGGGELLILTLTVTIPSGEGTFCIDSGDADDELYDWLFDDPIPHFDQYCWTVADSIGEAVIDHGGSQLPTKFELGQNHPNPFNPITVIDFALPTASQVNVDIYNVLGQKVRTLVNESMPAGYYSATWDGTNDNGQPAASGIYFYKIEAGKFQNTKKLMMLK
jgi:hypothetical protein